MLHLSVAYYEQAISCLFSFKSHPKITDWFSLSFTEKKIIAENISSVECFLSFHIKVISTHFSTYKIPMLLSLCFLFLISELYSTAPRCCYCYVAIEIFFLSSTYVHSIDVCWDVQKIEHRVRCYVLEAMSNLINFVFASCCGKLIMKIKKADATFVGIIC